MATTNKPRVLYVDDEQNNLNSFRANFRREYDVYTAISAQEGIEVLAKEPIEIIVADQRMPGMTGVEFFENVVDDYPDCIRILLTGYADIEAVINAINKGQIYKFISKPWNEDTLRVAINNAKDIYDARRELKEKNISLQKAYDELDRFVYSVSHDLRAPLVSIQGVIYLANQEVKDEKAIEYFNMTKEMVDKLDEFIHNIIDYYKSTHEGNMTVEVDLNKMLKDISDEYRYHPAMEQTTLEYQVEGVSTFTTNEVKLRIILNNLISNAIKYRDEVKSQHHVAVRITGGHSGMEIQVVDNGVGISEDNQEKVFQMFYRDAKGNSGSGLGLYLVKEAVKRLGGTITVNSAKGEGTTMTVSLPNFEESAL
ncbi:MAG: hybrid sensor histidine kinase/response regulator [Bacteroidetes bacterium]|nr:MAG: hybrid sensor histidine kinase/response regulator [Bacteroidota bacterium]